MRRRTLGETIRLVVLTAPLLWSAACGSHGGGGGSCVNEYSVDFSLSDASRFDGGLTCHLVCNSENFGGPPDAGCELIFQPDGGTLCIVEAYCLE